uniref:CCHC-type domain-containing protein n=1 Tax=Fagus sylvatica TaxID=28930 RepID=A0A2N9F5E5_FAGSY
MAINASIAMVGLVKFDGTGNFGLWQRRVKDLLVQQGLVKALYGKTKKPEKMTDDEWEELDMKAVSTIRLLLADEVMYDVMEENSTVGIWLNLEKRYMSKSLTNKLHLKQKLYGLKMTEGADLRQHINTFKQIISDMLRIDIKFEDEDKAMMLLTSLPASYEHLVTTLLYGKETLELEEVSGALLDHYQRKHKDSAESSGEGLVVKGYQDRGRKKDKDDKSARGRSKSKSKAVKCFKCQKKGHMKRDCPEWNKGKEESSTSVNVVADSESDGDMLSVSSSTDGLNNSWLLDSACSFHVTPHRNWFDTYRSINCGSVRMGNDATCTIIGMGTIKIKMSDGVVRTLEEVRHIPDMRKNLISLGTLDSKGYSYKSENGIMKVSKGAMIVMTGQKISSNVYKLLGNTILGGVAAVVESEDDDTLLWHMRLGHISERGMRELHKRNLLTGIKSCKLDFCKYCIMGKQCRKSLVYFLKNKSEAFAKFKIWKAEVENQTGRKIKCLRTDNGTEYRDGDFLKFCEEHGIKRHFTVRKTPQQNGVAERLNRTITETARCLRLNAELPKIFWAEAVDMACYIINRSPRVALDGKVAEEVWTGQEVDYSFMRIFGCPAYVHISSEDRSKLDPKSKKCIFLGFKKGVKGYKLWDPVAQKVVISRDVVFDEKSMTKAFKEEKSQAAESSNNIGRSTVQVELDELESQSNEEPHSNDQEQDSTRSDRPKRNKRPPVRYGFEDLVSYALLTSSEDPSTFQEAIESSEKDKWMEAMVEENESLSKNKTWELTELPKGKKPIVRHTSIRAVLALVADQDLELEQLDVKTAFLHGNLDEEIFMEQPEGFKQPGTENLVCRLKKSLYGLKQLKSLLHKEFEMKDLGAAKKILGMEIHRDRGARKLWLSQKNYIRKVLEKFSMLDAKPVSTPLANHFRLSGSQCPKNEEEIENMSKVPYASAVGCLMYAMVCTRPDLAHAMSTVSRCMANPGREHWNAVKWIFRYLKGTAEHGILFSRQPGTNSVVGYVDADYAGEVDDRRSTTGYVFTLSGGPICWKSTLQSIVAMSTTEAEYMAVAEAAKEALWLKGLVKELGLNQGGVQMHCDSQSAIYLAKESGDIVLEKVHTSENAADMLMKPVTTAKFKHCLDLVNSEVQVGAMIGEDGKTSGIKKFDGIEFGCWRVIRLTLSRSVAHNVVKETTTVGLMTALFGMYEKPSANNKVQLVKKLFNLNMAEGIVVEKHLNEFNTITNQLSSMEIEFDDEIHALIVLASLPNSWEAMRMAVSNSAGKGKLKYDDIRDLILSEKVRRRDADIDNAEGQAFVTENKGRNRSTWHNDRAMFSDRHWRKEQTEDKDQKHDNEKDTTVVVDDEEVVVLSVQEQKYLCFNLISTPVMDRVSYCNHLGNGRWKLTKGHMVVARGRICCGLYKTHVKACKKKLNTVGTTDKTPQLRVMVNSVAPKRVKFSLPDSATDGGAICDGECRDGKLTTCDDDELKDSKDLEQGERALTLEMVEPHEKRSIGECRKDNSKNIWVSNEGEPKNWIKDIQGEINSLRMKGIDIDVVFSLLVKMTKKLELCASSTGMDPN